jgi:AAA family ATP:ADP antiporter
MIPQGKNVRLLFKRTFDIREGEMRRALLMQLNIFLLISTLLIIKPTINSLFLTNVGIEKLPLAFILVAVGAGIIMSFYSRWLRTRPLNKIIHYTLLVSVCSITLFALLLRFNYIETWVLYLFYIWVAVFGVLSASQFWIFANIVFNAREAKRLFGLIGSGAITGGIFGGYLASLLAPVMGSENLLFVGVILLLICIPVNKAIWKSPELSGVSFQRQKRRMAKLAERPVRLIRDSRHLTYLALITVFAVLVARLVDYQFSAISSSKIADEDELTSFFGFWFSNFNIISLLIQLFLTRKVVGVFGVGISLYILPAGILIGALAVLFVPGLWSAVFIKSADGSLKQSINKSAIELLVLPVPAEIKNQAKTFIDVVVDSLATGLSGIILIMLVNGLDLSTRFISLSIILLVFLWFYFATKVRREYVLLFKRKLKQFSADEDHALQDISVESVYGGIKSVLEKGTTRQILYVLNHTEDIRHERLFESLRVLLQHDSPEVRAEALRRLYHYKTEIPAHEINLMVHDHDYQVKVAAIEYLIEHSPDRRKELIAKYLKDKDYRVGGAAALSLVHEARDNPELKAHFKLEALIWERIGRIESTTEPEELQFRKINLLRMIGLAGYPHFFPLIHDFLQSTEGPVQKQAILSAGNTLDPVFIPVLMTFLKDKRTRDAAVTALANSGSMITDYLRAEITRPDPDPEIIRHIPRVMEKIGTQGSVNFLFELLDFGEPVVRTEALDALTKLKIQFPHLVFNKKRILHSILDEAKLYLETLSALYSQQTGIQKETPSASAARQADPFKARRKLILLLEQRLDENLERIFKLLELKYPPDEIDTVYRNIRSEKSDLRVNAIEFLDNLLEVNLKKVLIPIIETLMMETITPEILKSLNVRICSQYECIDLLLKGKDMQLKIAVIELIFSLKESRYIGLLQPCSHHRDQKIRTSAQRTIDHLAGFSGKQKPDPLRLK